MSISIEQWRERGHVARLMDRKIFCVDSGELDKPVIFLIHGFPTASWDWERIWPLLNESHRLVALDMLGFGFSDKPNPHEYSIMEQADLCEALIAERKLAKFHVLAHDYGDTVAQELLARQNEGSGEGTWLSVCFLNGGLFPETHRARLIQRLLLSRLGPLINQLTTKRTFDKSFSAVFGPDTKPSSAELESFWNLINYNGGRHCFHNLISYMSDRKKHRQRWVRALQDSRVSNRLDQWLDRPGFGRAHGRAIPRGSQSRSLHRGAPARWTLPSGRGSRRGGSRIFRFLTPALVVPRSHRQDTRFEPEEPWLVCLIFGWRHFRYRRRL